MATITIENGQYTNLDNALPYGSTNIGRRRIFSSFNRVTDLENGENAAKLVNAVEIDWNGAIVPTSYTGDSYNIINSTGDLLQYIQGKVNENDMIGLLNKYIKVGTNLQTEERDDGFYINTKNS